MCGRRSCRIVAVVRNSEHPDKQVGVTKSEDQWTVLSSGFEKCQLLTQNELFSFLNSLHFGSPLE